MNQSSRSSLFCLSVPYPPVIMKNQRLLNFLLSGMVLPISIMAAPDAADTSEYIFVQLFFSISVQSAVNLDDLIPVRFPADSMLLPVSYSLYNILQFHSVSIPDEIQFDQPLE